MVSREDLEKMSPNIDQFMKIENSGAIRGVIITLRARENEGYDFYSRYFAPWVGIPEDPVTGSAHTVLAPYWGKVYSKYQFQGESMEKIPLLFLSKERAHCWHVRPGFYRATLALPLAPCLLC